MFTWLPSFISYEVWILHTCIIQSKRFGIQWKLWLNEQLSTCQLRIKITMFSSYLAVLGLLSIFCNFFDPQFNLLIFRIFFPIFLHWLINLLFPFSPFDPSFFSIFRPSFKYLFHHFFIVETRILELVCSRIQTFIEFWNRNVAQWLTSHASSHLLILVSTDVEWSWTKTFSGVHQCPDVFLNVANPHRFQ